MSRDRCVPLEGAFNVRDLGGYETADGRTTRWGLVYRSDTLHLLTPADATAMGSLGIRAIYDLRRRYEREAAPTALPADHDHRDIHLDVLDDPAAEAGPTRLQQLLDGKAIVRDVEYMSGRYIGMLDEGAEVFGRLLTALTEPDGLPALFHCAAGKDRTGLAAALLLSLLGVDRATVLDDYEASNVYRTDRYLEHKRPEWEAAGLDVELLRPAITVHPAVLANALDWVDRTHGDVDAYLTNAAGMSPAALPRLRELLLD